MNTTAGFAILVMVVVAGAIGFCWAFFSERRVKLSRKDLQKMFDAQLPHIMAYGSVQAVQLNLTNRKIELDIMLSTQVVGRKWHLRVTTAGAPFYNSEKGAVFFKAERLTIISATDLSTEVDKPKETLANMVGQFIDWMGIKGLSDKKEAITESVDTASNIISKKFDEASQAAINKVAQSCLDRFPIYTLTDDIKGNLARLAVEDVLVEGDSICIQLSIWRLTAAAIGYLVLFFIGIVALLMLYRSLMSLG